MGIKKEVVDFYVRIDLRDKGDFGSIRIGGMPRSDYERDRDLKHLADAAKLRLNSFEDERGDVSIVIERQDVCEHCGNRWTEDSRIYNGGCCSADVEPEEIAIALF